MLISPNRQIAVSNLGWVDKASLWRYDEPIDRVDSISLSDAKYLTIHSGGDPSVFSVLHHYDGERLRCTVHSFEDIGQPLCSAEISQGRVQFDGKVEAFRKVPRYYVAYYNPGTKAEFHLFSIDPIRPEMSVQPLDWYDDSYDKGYQGIVGVVELPSGNLLVSIQRDSSPVLYDPLTRKVLRKISLAGNHGNPKIRVLERRKEIWADDYDSLIKLDIETLELRNSVKLQSAAQGTAQFIGDWSFNQDESLCFVARPFSGDVVAISTDTMKVKYTASTGRQPLEAVVLANQLVVGRDWKSGELLRGQLKKKWFG